MSRVKNRCGANVGLCRVLVFFSEMVGRGQFMTLVPTHVLHHPLRIPSMHHIIGIRNYTYLL